MSEKSKKADDRQEKPSAPCTAELEEALKNLGRRYFISPEEYARSLGPFEGRNYKFLVRLDQFSIASMEKNTAVRMYSGEAHSAATQIADYLRWDEKGIELCQVDTGQNSANQITFGPVRFSWDELEKAAKTGEDFVSKEVKIPKESFDELLMLRHVSYEKGDKKAIKEIAEAFWDFKESKLDGLIEEISKGEGQRKEQLIEKFFDWLQNDRELGVIAVDKIDSLRIRNADGWTAADQIVSYASVYAVLQLLILAKHDERYRKLLAERHEICGGLEEIATYTLAIVTLRDKGIDDTPYHQLGKDIGLFYTIAKPSQS